MQKVALLPPPIRDALAATSWFFIGYGAADRNLRGLLRASRDSRGGRLVTAAGAPVSHEDFAGLMRLAETGAFRPVIDRTYDLDDVAEAHRYVDGGHKRGNVVLRIR